MFCRDDEFRGQGGMTISSETGLGGCNDDESVMVSESGITRRVQERGEGVGVR